MKARCFAAAFFLAASCSSERPPAPTPAVSAPEPSPASTARASIKVSSLLSIPPAGPDGGPWSFSGGQDTFDLRVSLEGRGAVRATVKVTDSKGRVVHTDEQQHEVDGSMELTFPRVTLPGEGSYKLEFEVTAPGVRQSSTVTIHRGK